MILYHSVSPHGGVPNAVSPATIGFLGFKGLNTENESSGVVGQLGSGVELAGVAKLSVALTKRNPLKSYTNLHMVSNYINTFVRTLSAWLPPILLMISAYAKSILTFSMDNSSTHKFSWEM